MHNEEDDALPPIVERVSFAEMIDRARTFVASLLMFGRLYFALLFVLLFLTVIYYVRTEPTYTAVAFIGPPNPSPSTSLLSSMGAPSIGSSLSKRILGGGQSSVGDPFQELQQLLQTPRLEIELVQKDHFLQRIFYKQWDGKNDRWVPPGTIVDVLSALKKALNRPATTHPDVLRLDNFLLNNLKITQAAALATSPVASITSTGTGYYSISLTFNDPEEAKRLLADYLNRADTIIRKDQLSDVEARIQFINSELPKITQTEQREALIQTLAAQEQLKIMLVADKRYSFVMVSPPYASPLPTTPMKPTKAFIVILVLSLFLWAGLVALKPRSTFLQKCLHFFERRERP